MNRQKLLLNHGICDLARSKTIVSMPFLESASPKTSPSLVAPSTLGRIVLKSELFVDMAAKV